jgi:hypothetical protein
VCDAIGFAGSLAEFGSYFADIFTAMPGTIGLHAELRRRGAALIYLDDRAENIAAGAARGWRAILHESPEQSRAALVTAGVLPA